MLSRATFRTLRLSSQSSLAPARTLRQASRRNLTTAPPHLRSRSWKNSVLRWGIAGAGIYFYNTSPVFAEAPENNLLNPNVDALHDETSSETLDTLTASSRNRRAAQPSALQNTLSSASESQIALTDKPSSSSSSSPSPQRDSHLDSATLTPDESSTPGGAAELEEEAANEGAFNEETGEINWDCPCLGGMAYGPCGEEFRAAFSCFVYSKEDPKGMECIDKFQGMQDCFRAHPEHYKAELEDVDDEETRKGLEEERMKIEGEVENRRKDLKERGLLQEGDAGTEIPTTTAQGSDKAVQSGKAPNLESGNVKPAPAQSSPTSTSTSSEPQSISEQAHSSTTSPGTPAKTTSHTPQGYTQDKEVKLGASSQTIRQPKAPKVDKEARSETEELVPKAAHDATTTNTVDTHSKAKSA